MKELSQPEQFVVAEKVDIEAPKGILNNVAVLGPCREHTQVEISLTDSKNIGVIGNIRQSGDIENTPGCILIFKDKKIETNRGVIIAKRHIHMKPEEAQNHHLIDNEEVTVVVKDTDRTIAFSNVVVRVNKNYRLAMHLDTDEANACGCNEDSFGRFKALILKK